MQFQLALFNWNGTLVNEKDFHVGAARLIQTLSLYHEVQKVIVSSAPTSTIQRIQRLRIADRFTRIHLCVRNKKKTIRNILSQLRVKPQHAFYVDDRADGILQARSLGVTTIGFTNGYDSAESIRAVKPDFVIDSLMQILEIYRTPYYPQPRRAPKIFGARLFYCYNADI
jgi:FMN phosphatase YigB (HAD superfamily)